MNLRVITIVLDADDPGTPPFCSLLRQRLRHPQNTRKLIGYTDQIAEGPTRLPPPRLTPGPSAD